MPSVEHSTQQHPKQSLRSWGRLYENNLCELSHQPTPQQERQMRRFKSQHHAQRFLAFHGIVNNLFRLGRHMMKARNYRILLDRSFVEWDRVSSTQSSRFAPGAGSTQSSGLAQTKESPEYPWRFRVCWCTLVCARGQN